MPEETWDEVEEELNEEWKIIMSSNECDMSVMDKCLINDKWCTYKNCPRKFSRI